jgi:hypothetical protein
VVVLRPETKANTKGDPGKIINKGDHVQNLLREYQEKSVLGDRLDRSIEDHALSLLQEYREKIDLGDRRDKSIKDHVRKLLQNSLIIPPTRIMAEELDVMQKCEVKISNYLEAVSSPSLTFAKHEKNTSIILFKIVSMYFIRFLRALSQVLTKTTIVAPKSSSRQAEKPITPPANEYHPSLHIPNQIKDYVDAKLSRSKSHHANTYMGEGRPRRKSIQSVDDVM